MENKIYNIEHFTSDADFKIAVNPRYKPENRGNDKVFFNVNVNELFGLTVNTPGMRTALNKAFQVSKNYVPVASGVTKRSYTMKILGKNAAQIFFDPNKVVGASRFGIKVKSYYVPHIAENPGRFNWLSIVIKRFYDSLYASVKAIIRKIKNKSLREATATTMLGMGLVFKTKLDATYKIKKEDALKAQKKKKEDDKARDVRRKNLLKQRAEIKKAKLEAKK